MGLRGGISRLLSHLGYEVRRIRAPQTDAHRLGQDPFADLWHLAGQQERPVIFDVGANTGQTILKLRERFSRPIIHAFEPGPEPFAELAQRTSGTSDLHLNNVALGARAGVMPYFESAASSAMNSLLEPRPEGWGGGCVKEQRKVAVTTLDDYCRERKVDRIDILKTDTQGYDFEVIKGGAGMIARRAVQLIYMEILFSDMYRGQARLDEIYGYLADQGFVLVTFYPFYYWGNKASWTEALFVHPGYSAT
jgi:FkbM family methyltransferase